MQAHRHNMLLFLMGIFGFCTCAGLLWVDLHGTQVYSQFLPQVLTTAMKPFVLSLPAVGIVGMMLFGAIQIKPSS